MPAVKNITDIQNDLIASIYENTIEAISGQTLQDRLRDMAVSYINRVTDKPYLGYREFSASRGYDYLEAVIRSGTQYQCTNVLGHSGAWNPANFTALSGGGGSANLATTLGIGNSTGGLNIVSPDGFSTLGIVNGSASMYYINGAVNGEFAVTNIAARLDWDNGTNNGTLSINNSNSYWEHSSNININAPTIEIMPASSLSRVLIQDSILNISHTDGTSFSSNITLDGTSIELASSLPVLLHNWDTSTYEARIKVTPLFSEVFYGADPGGLFNNGGYYKVTEFLSTLQHSVKINFDAPVYHITNITPSSYLYVDASGNLVPGATPLTSVPGLASVLGISGVTGNQPIKSANNKSQLFVYNAGSSLFYTDGSETTSLTVNSGAAGMTYDDGGGNTSAVSLDASGFNITTVTAGQVGLDDGTNLSYVGFTPVQARLIFNNSISGNGGGMSVTDPTNYISHTLETVLDSILVTLAQGVMQSSDTFSQLNLGTGASALLYNDGTISSFMSSNTGQFHLNWSNGTDTAEISGDPTSLTLYHTGFIFAAAPIQVQYLRNISGVNAINTSGFLYDGSVVVSVDWNNRYLRNSAAGIVVDWDSQYLYTTTGSRVMNWNARALVDSTLATVLDWSALDLSGNWTAVTQTAGNNSTRIATTAFVMTAAGSYLPLSGGTMTGALILNADATTSLGAVTLQQLIASEAGFTQLQQGYDASTNLFPTALNTSPLVATIKKGFVWYITVAGTLGGTPVQPGDVVTALIDSPGTTAANWVITQHDLGYTPVSNVLTSAYIFVGNGSNVATGVAMSGDITINNSGVTAIGASKVTNTMLAGSIAYSKLSLTGAILNADLAGSIAYSKLSLTGAILNADLAGSIADSKLASIYIYADGSRGLSANWSAGAFNISSQSQTVNGTGGNGYMELLTQSSPVSSGAANSVRLFSNAGLFAWIKPSDGFIRQFSSTLTASRTYTFQDRNGTLADDTDLGLKMTKTSNLSDVSSVSTSRTNLGLGTIIYFSFASHNPADASTSFIGNLTGIIPASSSVSRFRIEAPITGTFNRLRFAANMAAGTTETATVKLNNKTAGTTVTIDSAFVYNTTPKVYTSIGFAVTLGDELEIEIDNPTWATNPTAIQGGFQGFINY